MLLVSDMLVVVDFAMLQYAAIQAHLRLQRDSLLLMMLDCLLAALNLSRQLDDLHTSNTQLLIHVLQKPTHPDVPFAH